MWVPIRVLVAPLSIHLHVNGLGKVAEEVHDCVLVTHVADPEEALGFGLSRAGHRSHLESKAVDEKYPPLSVAVSNT